MNNTEFVPKWIAWETTGRCNLNCIHCRCEENPSIKDEFSTVEAKKLIDDIVSFSKPVFALSGGEPLLRKDIFEIAAYGTEKGMRVALATNGTLVDDNTCKEIKASGIQIVSLSIDGSAPEIHDNFRNQKGAFDATLRSIEFFKKYNIPFLINSSFTKRNQEDIPNTLQLAKKLGAVAWYMFMVVPTGRGQEIMEELISAEDYEKILDWHFYQEIKEPELIMRPSCAPHYYRIVLQKDKEGYQGYKRRHLSFATSAAKGCVAAQVVALITHQGEVQPCSYFPKSAGNVKEVHFKDIWEHSDLLNNLRDYGKFKGRCSQCEYLKVCGGCRARANAIHDDYLEEEPFCNYMPRRLVKERKLPEVA